MTDFSRNELVVLQVSLDTMVRTEGNSMAQAGINGLKGDVTEILATRLSSAVSALGKINTAIEALDAAEKPVTEGG